MSEPAESDDVPALLSARRQHVTTTSARSTLLTVLGEYVFPTDQPVWTSTFVSALGLLGIEEKSARQALNRTSAQGLIESQRHGRRVQWSLTDHGREVLKEGTDRIYGFMRRRRPWDGRWLVLSIPIPEKRRQLRHHLSTRLRWLGLGSPAPGLWITPNAGRDRDVQAVLDKLGLTDAASGWIGPSAGIGPESRLLARAWDLADVAEQYDDFLSTFENREARTDEEAFVAQIQLVQAWRRFPFVDPEIPAELLESDWPGIRAGNVFHDRHARWHRPAQAAWDSLADG